MFREWIKRNESKISSSLLRNQEILKATHLAIFANRVHNQMLLAAYVC